MTAPGRVPPDEWVEAAATEYVRCQYHREHREEPCDPPGPSQIDNMRRALTAVLPLVAAEREKAVRDALTAAVERVEAEREDDRRYRAAEGYGEEPCDVPHGQCHAAAAYFAFDMAARIVADLRDGAR